MFDQLFSPIQIRSLKLNNRVALPGMVTKMAKNRYVTQMLIDYHEARAAGGCGINFLEAASVYEPTAPASFLSIGDDKYVPRLKELTDAIHVAGGKAGIQLWQGGLVASMLDPSVECFIPSEIKIPVTVLNSQEPKELAFPAATKEKIKEVINAFGDAAKRAVNAGFDCLEIHIAHGYSTHVFLSPAFNQRTDEYGGSFENRARFPLECIDAIRSNIPESVPVSMRIVAKDDNVPNGLTLEDMIEFCKLAKIHGVDMVNVSRGNSFTAGLLESPPMDISQGFNVDNAALIRKETGIVTLAVGRINHAEMANSIIAEGKADMVIMGRAQIADPEFCNKAKAGHPEDIIHCIGCNQGCDDIVCVVDDRHITCTRNPAVGREKEFAIKKTDSPKKILVVGGGVAGMEAAITLQKEGHCCTLIEKSDQLGGQFRLAGKAPRKAETGTAVESSIDQLKRSGVTIMTSTLASSEVFDKIQPDKVLIAIGASPIIPKIPGVDGNNVISFPAVLDDNVTPTGRVCVIGGGLVGLEVAEYLAAKGTEVVDVEMLDEVGKDLGGFRRDCVKENIGKLPITVMTNTKCLEITGSSVIVEKDGEKQKVTCDFIVLAVGSKPNDYSAITSICDSKKIPYQVVGDAKHAGKAITAIAEAAETARRI